MTADPLPEAYRRFLAETFGPDCLFGAEEMEPYAADETEGLRSAPRAVVRARTAEQVSALLALSSRHGVPVTPRTGGTGVTGGAVPVRGGVVLSLERMDRIVEIDEENLCAVVQPGVITGVLQRAVEERGLFYPPDPASLDSCALGGNVAECAGGPRAAKYGVTRHFVLGLETVLASGEIMRWGGKLRKDVAGYDVMSLVVGSEGTLAVVTEMTLRLLPRPAATRDLLAPFGSLAQASRAAVAVARARVQPAAAEFMDELCLAAARDFLGALPRGLEGAGAVLLLQMDGPTAEEVERSSLAAGEACLTHGARDVLVASSASEKERLWDMRRKLREALLARCPTKFSEDVVVPPASIPAFLDDLRALEPSWGGAEAACFGHIGDGNVHVNVLRGALSEDEWLRTRPKRMEEIFRLALARGGSLSGEHGIGLTKRDFLSLRLNPAQLRLLARLKKAFDPAGILNPGKILPDSLA